MEKIFICQIQSDELSDVKTAMESIGYQGEHMVLLPEYINFTTRGHRAEIPGVIEHLKAYTKCNIDRHVVTAIMRDGAPWAAYYHNGIETLIYQKVKQDGIWGDVDRTSSLIGERPFIAVGDHKVYVLCCRDHELLGSLNLKNAIVLIPCFMGHDDFGGGAPLGHQLGNSLSGNHVFLANKKKDGCPSFYADKIGQVVITAGNSHLSVTGILLRS